MTRLVNDASSFAHEALRGFAAAHQDHVVPVPGGVVRSHESVPGEVALVLGGGSGHYPAFAGWVGAGMAHGAVCGNVFASPSAGQVRSVVRAAESGGGVLLGFGNYAGDVLHFGQAAEQLRAEGLDVRVVAVTDDVASAPRDEAHRRRGIAGDLLVFVVAGSAAASGRDLDEVERVTRRANDRTRTLGVAFSGCTLPGADGPLFTLDEGTMGIGLGIHGEPGLSAQTLGSARQVADVLVDGVLAEEPPRGTDGYDGRVAVLLNGLGGTKYEELFVVYARVAARLAEAGVTVVRPEVGEHVTSLDMAGLSLSVMYLDSELEALWSAPVDTPALRRSPGTERRRAVDALVTDVDRPRAVAPGAPASREAAGWLVGGLERARRIAQDEADAWGALDAVAGDGDHGRGMLAGVDAALGAAREVTDAGGGIRTAVLRAGEAWSDGAGGTSGALWGAALAAAAGELDDGRGVGSDDVTRAVRAAVSAVERLGGAVLGDKTLVDAAAPFAESLAGSIAVGAGLSAAWVEAADVAHRSAAATADLTARLGRARTHGSVSLGHADPGATSFAALVRAVLPDPPSPPTVPSSVHPTEQEGRPS